MRNFNGLKIISLFGVLAVLPLSPYSFADSPPPTGGDGSGGGSTIRHKLSEDALPALSMKGAKLIPVTELEKLVAPYLSSIEGKLPGFAKDLRKGLTDIKWYTDPKPFNPVACQDESMFDIHQNIRACQDEDSIRINKAFYRDHPKILADIVAHELVVHYLRVFPVGKKVMRVSKAVRNVNASAEELDQALAAGGFAKYLTVSQLASIRENIRAKACSINTDHPTADQVLALGHVLYDSLALIVNEGGADKALAQDIGLASGEINAAGESGPSSDVGKMSDALSFVQQKFGCMNDPPGSYPPQVLGSGEKAKTSLPSDENTELPRVSSETAK